MRKTISGLKFYIIIISYKIILGIVMSNVIKFQAPFEKLKLYESSPEIMLRKAIITQAVIDASNLSNQPKAKKLELDAKDWIFGNNDHFKETCMQADIEPSFIVRIAKKAIKLHKARQRSIKLHL